MTDKKKIDEQATLTVNTADGIVMSDTTFSAPDTMALVDLLKNAGIKSAMFNGPANLSVDQVDGPSSMVTNVSAPNLRMIMNMLEPEFKELGDMDGYAEVEPEVEPEVAPEMPSEVPQDTDVAVDAVVDADGNLSLVDDEMGDIEEDADYDYRDHDVHPSPYAGTGDKKIVQPNTKMVPARSGDNPLEEGKKLPASAIAEIKELLDNGSSPEEVADIMGVSVEQICDLMEESAKPKRFSDYFNEASKKNHIVPQAPVTAESLIQEFTGEGTRVVSKDVAFAMAAQQSMNGTASYVDAVERYNGTGYRVSEFRGPNTVASFEGGEMVQGDAMDDSDELDEATFSIETDDRGYKIVDDKGNTVEDGIHSGHEAHNSLHYWKNHKPADSELTEAPYHTSGGHAAAMRRDAMDRKLRQYGQPFYLNTDCGYASLNDLGTHDYFQHGGVVILEIDRNGKLGLNYVAGHHNAKPGTHVTVVTATSTGQKFRPGKVVDSFTMDEYENDRAGLEARLAQYGITPTKKLSVKTFD